MQSSFRFYAAGKSCIDLGTLGTRLLEICFDKRHRELPLAFRSGILSDLSHNIKELCKSETNVIAAWLERREGASLHTAKNYQFSYKNIELLHCMTYDNIIRTSSVEHCDLWLETHTVASLCCPQVFSFFLPFLPADLKRPISWSIPRVLFALQFQPTCSRPATWFKVFG